MNGTIFGNNWVTRLLVINVIVFIIQNIVTFTNSFTVDYGCQGLRTSMSGITAYFGLTTALVAGKGFVYQVVTYMFLHGSFMHILFNMYALFIFGLPIEQLWGGKKFLGYFFFTGIGAGVTILAMNLIMHHFFGGSDGYCIPTIGASGAVFGILLAFGILYPEVEILLFFIIPLKARYLVILYGAIEMYLLVSSGGQGTISHIGHLGGLLFGIIYFLITRRKAISFRGKKFTAEIARQASVPASGPSDDVEFLRKILELVRLGGPSVIDDDAYQRLNYLMIMNDEKGLCVEEDFSAEDDYCLKCENIRACYIRLIKKYL